MRFRLPASPVEESAVARAFAWGAAAVATAAIMLYGQSYLLPPIALAVSALAHRSSHRRRHLPRGVVRQVVIAALIVACVAYLILDSTQALFGGQLPQAHFALLLLAVTSFDLKTRRNLYSSLWISLALVYLAGVFAWDFAFGAFSLAWLACLAGFWAASHLRAQRPADLRLPGRPALGFAAAVLLVGVGAFILVPQPQIRPLSPLVVSLPNTIRFQGTLESPALPLVSVSGAQTGPTNLVNLHFRGGLGDAVVMYVRTGSPAYWLGDVLDTYANGAWTASLSGIQVYPGFVAPSSLPAEAPVRGTFVQTYRVVRPLSSTLYAADPTASIYFPNVEIGRDPYGRWHAPSPLQPGQTYSVVSYLPDLNPAALRQAPSLAGAVSGVYLDASSLSARGHQLAQGIVRGVPDDQYDRAAAINAYLQRHYTYTQRLPPVPPGRDPVDWFLFDSRAGYCEQFASAEVLMLRSLGIPARLATGYSTGEYSPVLDQAVVRERDAHAWVQAYFPGYSWVPFDPSPGFTAVPAGQVVDRWAVSGLGFLAPRVQVAAAAVGWPALLVLLVPLLVLLVVVGRRRGALRGWRRREPRSELMALYERAQRRLPRRRRPAETPLEYWAAVGSAEGLRRLTEAVNEAAYAGRPPSADVLRELRRTPPRGEDSGPA